MARLLPQNGLIVDVRGNGGGNINAGEALLQVLTPGTIEPEPFHFINTPTTLKLCKSSSFLSDWVESIDLSVQTGEVYSQGFPLTPTALANASLGYHYPGKVVLVIDALCYSTTDIFTAGYQDHEIGKVLGTDGRTGAGGANVWTYNFFQGLDGFPSLPKGVSFRTAIRRSTRVRSKAGVPLEDLGVRPDSVHRMTRADILQGNPDLIAAAASFLV
jgi:C-terminal processing protease CtpA/Prc